MFLCAQTVLGGGRIVSWNGHPVGDEFKTEMTAISAGYMHSLALTDEDRIVAWGDNSEGQLEIPEDDNESIVQISAGGFHNLALTKKGRVIGWGLNSDGQAIPPSWISKSCTAVDAGMFHSMVLHKAGFVYTWGYNEFGQSYTPWGLWSVQQISAGAMHSLALRSDGVVFAWGDDSFGQITVPDDIPSDITAISAGYFHNLALTRNGKVIAWGDNTYGQVDVPPEALNNVIAISAGHMHSVALKANGQVIIWGGEIGQPQSGEATSAIRLSAISAGGYHTLGLIPSAEDDNNNGIPDWWELQYGLGSSEGDKSDFDKDGFSDYDEYLSDTDPTDRDSHFSIAITYSDEEAEVVFGPVSVERLYTVQAVSDMELGQWKKVSGNVQESTSSSGKMKRMSIESSATASTYETKIFRVVIESP